MYMTERRHSNSTRMMGLMGTAAVIAAVGAVLVSMHETIIPTQQPRDMVMVIQDEPVQKPVEKKVVKEESKPIETPRVEIPPPDIDIEPIAPPIAPPVEFTADPAPAAEPAPAPAATGPAATRPKLNAGAKPEYPPSAVRARESGTTSLTLCVSKAGTVTQASISASSGSQTLDQAALAWIKRERFKPGTENGQPVDVCDQTLSYLWQLPK